MNEEEVNIIFDSIQKVENNNCISTYGGIDIEDIKSAMKRLNKVPNYNDLLEENKELNKYKDAWNELKNDNTELIEYNNRVVKDCKIYKNRKMYLLEQKYKLEGKQYEMSNMR